MLCSILVVVGGPCVLCLCPAYGVERPEGFGTCSAGAENPCPAEPCRHWHRNVLISIYAVYRIFYVYPGTVLRGYRVSGKCVGAPKLPGRSYQTVDGRLGAPEQHVRDFRRGQLRSPAAWKQHHTSH